MATKMNKMAMGNQAAAFDAKTSLFKLVNTIINLVIAIIALLFMYIFIGAIFYSMGGIDIQIDPLFGPAYGFCQAIFPIIDSIVGVEFSPFSPVIFIFLLILSMALILSTLSKVPAWMKQTADVTVMAMMPAPWHFEKGEIMMRDGNYSGAIDEFNAVLKKSPGYSGAYYNLGYCCMMMSQYEKAASLFQEELKKNPAHFSSRLNIGFCFIKLGRAGDAIRELQEATRLGPDNGYAHFWLGNAYRLAGKYDDARLEYQKAKNIAPDLENLDLNMGENYLDLGALDDAISELKLATNRKSYSEQAHYKLGLAYSKKGRYEDAIAEYNAALRINPQNAEYKDMLELAKSSLKGVSASAITIQKEVIKEIVKVPCEYCRTLVEVTQTKCPNCGAPLRPH